METTSILCYDAMVVGHLGSYIITYDDILTQNMLCDTVGHCTVWLCVLYVSYDKIMTHTKVWYENSVYNFHFDRESLCAPFRVFRHGYVDVEWESSMVRWRGYPSIQRDQLELLTMSGDGEKQKKLRREITTVKSLSWQALFLRLSSALRNLSPPSASLPIKVSRIASLPG